MREPLSQIFRLAIIWRLRALLSSENKATIARRTTIKGYSIYQLQISVLKWYNMSL